MCLERYSLHVSQNVNTWGNISVNVRLGTKQRNEEWKKKYLLFILALLLGKYSQHAWPVESQIICN